MPFFINTCDFPEECSQFQTGKRKKGKCFSGPTEQAARAEYQYHLEHSSCHYKSANLASRMAAAKEVYTWGEEEDQGEDLASEVHTPPPEEPSREDVDEVEARLSQEIGNTMNAAVARMHCNLAAIQPRKRRAIEGPGSSSNAAEVKLSTATEAEARLLQRGP